MFQVPGFGGVCALVAATTLSGCASGPRPVGVISHAVFVELHDPALAPSVLADADAMLRGIPGVVSYAAGTHIDVGRPGILDDYDVGLIIGFDAQSDYARYVDHPDHVAFVTKWASSIRALRVYDVHDPD
ncbi:MAG: Dabb family protein [Planctomycetota bacterium]